MRTEILELWDRSKHDIGIYKEEWRKMLVAADAAVDAAVDAYAAAIDAYADARAAVDARAAYDAYSAADAVAFAFVTAADAAAADHWFKRAEERMEALR